MITSSRDGLLHQFIDKMKDPNYRQQSFYPLAEDVAQDFTPIVGEAKSAYEADQAFKNMGRTFRGGDYFSSAGYLGEGLTGLLGAVPVLGLGVRGIRNVTEPIAEQAPVFYSKLTNFFKDAPQKKAQGKQWQGMLEPQKSGVKSEEVEYTGIKSLLDENPDKVFTKEELQEVADSNRIQVEENVYGDSSVITKQEYEDEPHIHSVYRADDPDGTYAGIVGEIIERPTALTGKNTVYEVNVPGMFRKPFRTIEEAKQYIAEKSDLGTTTRHSSYQLEGGENYKELVLKLPNTRKVYRIQDGRTGEVYEYDYPTRESAEKQARQGLVDIGDNSNFNIVEREVPDGNKLFQYPSHFNDINPLLHVRFNDRIDADGGKQLFIEELQSDWAQQGREKGFRNEAEFTKASKELAQKQADLLSRFKQLSNKAYPDKANNAPIFLRKDIRFYDELRSSGKDVKGLNNGEKDTLTADEMREASEINKQYSEIADQIRSLTETQRGKVANAPFVASTDKWTDLGLRRMLRWAVDNNYDSIGWTTGVQQVNRYETSFRQQVKNLDFTGLDDDLLLEVTTPSGSKTHIAFEKNADGKFVTANEYEGDIQPLEKVVGKDVAKRFYEGETYFEGDDLTIGGEGMKESYDRIIPKRMKEIARKMGEKNVKIEKVSAKTGDKVEESRLRYEVHDEDGAIDAFETREEAESRLPDLSEAYGGNTFVVDSYAEDLKKSDAKRENVWSMKITDKMREAIKKGLPLMAGAGVSTGLLAEYQNQKNQNQSLLY